MRAAQGEAGGEPQASQVTTSPRPRTHEPFEINRHLRWAAVHGIPKVPISSGAVRRLDVNAGAVFVLLAVAVVVAIRFFVFSGVGASLRKKQTAPDATEETKGTARPTRCSTSTASGRRTTRATADPAR